MTGLLLAGALLACGALAPVRCASARDAAEPTEVVKASSTSAFDPLTFRPTTIAGPTFTWEVRSATPQAAERTVCFEVWASSDAPVEPEATVKPCGPYRLIAKRPPSPSLVGMVHAGGRFALLVFNPSGTDVTIDGDHPHRSNGHFMTVEARQDGGILSLHGGLFTCAVSPIYLGDCWSGRLHG